MYRSTWKISNLVLVLTLALAGGVEAQQQHEQHHPGGMLLSHEQATGEPQETPAQAPMMQPPLTGVHPEGLATGSHVLQPVESSVPLGRQMPVEISQTSELADQALWLWAESHLLQAPPSRSPWS